jgi:microcystin-dependent protein
MGSYGVPVGAVIAFAGNLGPPITSPLPGQAPAPPGAGGDAYPANAVNAIEAWGWMACDGRQLQPDAYPELFQALGYQYGGTKDGPFNIPDYRGMFLRGVDHGTGKDPDAGKRTPTAPDIASQVGSHQEHALQSHGHQVKGPGPPPSASPEGPPAMLSVVPQAPAEPAGANVSTETRPSNISVNYLIRFSYFP